MTCRLIIYIFFLIHDVMLVISSKVISVLETLMIGFSFFFKLLKTYANSTKNAADLTIFRYYSKRVQEKDYP